MHSILLVRQTGAKKMTRVLVHAKKMTRVPIAEAKKMARVHIAEAKKMAAKKTVLRVRVQLRKDGECS